MKWSRQADRRRGGPHLLHALAIGGELSMFFQLWPSTERSAAAQGPCDGTPRYGWQSARAGRQKGHQRGERARAPGSRGCREARSGASERGGPRRFAANVRQEKRSTGLIRARLLRMSACVSVALGLPALGSRRPSCSGPVCSRLCPWRRRVHAMARRGGRVGQGIGGDDMRVRHARGGGPEG